MKKRKSPPTGRTGTRRTTAGRTARRDGLEIRRAGGIARLTLCPKTEGNRIGLRLAQALCEAAEDISADDSVVVVLVTGAGARFCTGVQQGGEWQDRFDWVRAVGRIVQPVIAQIQGDAVAEGLELALACDLRIASTRARFSMPQVVEGSLPRHGGTQRLPRIVGRSRALDLLLTGRKVSAAEAESMGLISRRVAPGQLSRTVRAVASELSRRGPIALRYAKEAVLHGSEMTLGQGIRLEEDLYALLQSTEDRNEGIRAFLEKRAPVFRGR
jgi:enoyl-CoA hydratase